jgi:hydrogenase maturation protease
MVTLVLGIGNLVLGDEGMGVHAARALIQKGYPPRTSVLDVGTVILDVLPALKNAERVIVLDAVKGGREPGGLYEMRLSDCETKACIASMHGFELDRTLALSGNECSPEVLVLEIEPEYIDWSLELSPTVSKTMPRLLSMVQRELGG